jgi:hypothetical protein
MSPPPYLTWKVEETEPDRGGVGLSSAQSVTSATTNIIAAMSPMQTHVDSLPEHSPKQSRPWATGGNPHLDETSTILETVCGDASGHPDSEEHKAAVANAEGLSTHLRWNRPKWFDHKRFRFAWSASAAMRQLSSELDLLISSSEPQNPPHMDARGSIFNDVKRDQHNVQITINNNHSP